MGNTDTVHRFLEAFDRRDESALMTICHPAIRFEPASTEVAQRAPYMGHAGIRQYLMDIGQTWDRFSLTVHAVAEGERAVVALGRIYVRTQGFVGDDPVGIVFGVRRGKVLWGKVYTSQEAALTAAGADRGS